MRWALVSLVGGAAVAIIFLSFSGINEKPTGNGGLSGTLCVGLVRLLAGPAQRGTTHTTEASRNGGKMHCDSE